MTLQFRGQFRLGERVHLLEEDNGGAQVFSLLPLRAQFVSDFSSADQNPFGILRFHVWNHRQKLLMGQIFERRQRIRMPQHALRREHHQRLPPLAQRLPPQQMEILPRIRGLTHLDIVPRRQLQKSLYARARIFPTLSSLAASPPTPPPSTPPPLFHP